MYQWFQMLIAFKTNWYALRQLLFFCSALQAASSCGASAAEASVRMQRAM